MVQRWPDAGALRDHPSRDCSIRVGGVLRAVNTIDPVTLVVAILTLLTALVTSVTAIIVLLIAVAFRSKDHT